MVKTEGQFCQLIKSVKIAITPLRQTAGVEHSPAGQLCVDPIMRLQASLEFDFPFYHGNPVDLTGKPWWLIPVFMDTGLPALYAGRKELGHVGTRLTLNR